MKRNFIRKILGGLSLTSALFIFQACYGTPQDMGLDILVEGKVKSKTSGLPIKGIKVSDVINGQYDLTDNDGLFSFYTEKHENMKFRFEDVDNMENGSFQNKDTLLTVIEEKVFLDINLNEN